MIASEWERFREERAKTLDEIMDMRQSVASVEKSMATEKHTNGDGEHNGIEANGMVEDKDDKSREEEMDVDDGGKEKPVSQKDETPGTIEGDDAEY